jgi:protein-L-isoaspartate(D-aspartate) O-methyltransferase
MIDFAHARRAMVDGQLRPYDITDLDLIAATLEVPRERFVSPGLEPLAYLDRDVLADPKRALIKPMVLGRLIQALEITPQDKVLDVAGGSGYSAAILARLADSVVALEDDPSCVKRCGDLARELGASNVSAVHGPLEAGWPALAPYDAVLINGRCEVEPQVLLRQLGEGGRLAGIFGTGPDAKAIVYRMDKGEIGGRTLFDAGAPLLPPFAKAQAFVF